MVTLLVAGLTSALLGGPDAARPGAVAVPGPATAVPAPRAEARPLPAPAPAAGVQATSALAALLDRRAAALLHHDHAGWLAAVDPAAGHFRADQGALFGRLAALPVTAWHYEVVGADPLPAGAGPGLGAGAYLAQVRLGYRLGPDTRDVLRTQYLTVTRRSGHWAIASDSAGPTERDLWDLGPITVARGTRSIVVAATASGGLAEAAARELDAAASRVDAVWGAAWPRTVVALIPADVAQLGTLLDRPAAALVPLAALTTGPLDRDPSGLAPPAGTADRVAINPVAFRSLSALGRQVVLTHETTHVATRASAVVTPPLWLEEGFADYVAYRGTGLAATAIAAHTLAAAARGVLPGQLPDAARFDPTRGDLDLAYEQAWLACTVLAGSGGPARLVRFYRLATGIGGVPPAARTAAGLPSPAALLAGAFRTVTGTDEAGFVRRWRARIDALA